VIIGFSENDEDIPKGMSIQRSGPSGLMMIPSTKVNSLLSERFQPDHYFQIVDFAAMSISSCTSTLFLITS